MQPTPKPCPMDPVLRALTGRWTTYILWLFATEGRLRFGELMGLMPLISAKVLTDRLRSLERQGIVSRHQKNTIPPQVSYQLTAQGRDLHAALNAIHQVALNWQAQGWSEAHGFPDTADAPTDIPADIPDATPETQTA